MALIGKLTKRVSEVLDFDVEFGTWLDAAGGDTGATLSVTVEDGLTLGQHLFTPSTGTAKVWVSGGQAGEAYRVTLTLSTSTGRIKQVQVGVKVKDS